MRVESSPAASAWSPETVKCTRQTEHSGRCLTHPSLALACVFVRHFHCSEPRRSDVKVMQVIPLPSSQLPSHSQVL